MACRGVVSRALVSTVAFVVLTASAGAQVVIGRILQRQGDVAVGDAVVFLGDSSGATGRSVTSRMNGAYRFRLDAPGSFIIRVRRLGFRPFVSPTLAVRAGDTLTYDIRLDDAPRVLPQVVVDAELDRVRDLQIFGRSGRSVPATYITSSQIEGVGKDARNYVDVLRGVHLLPLHIDHRCIRERPTSPCLKVFLDERLLSAEGDEEMFKDTEFVADPNEIDHIAVVRPVEARNDIGELHGGAILIYTRRFVARQRVVLHRP